MIFNLLQYIKPIWYFNLRPKVDYAYFPTIDTVREAGLDIQIDKRYVDEVAQQRDVAWRAFKQGFISSKETKGLDVWKKMSLPLSDEYLFLRKNFHPFWVVVVFIIRLILLNNPFKEVRAFRKHRCVKKESYVSSHFKYPEYKNYRSELVSQAPLISIIIPTLNRYDYLKDVLKDLERQTYRNFEVIVVDQTDDFKEEFYQGWKLNLTYWFQEEKALWKARNEAIKFSKGEYILLYDDDSLVDENWVEEHLKTLDFFNADLSSGVSISTVGAEVPEHYSYFCWSQQLDTGNVLLKKSIFREIGLFDRHFEKQRMGDGEFGLRAYLAGYRNISNPYAKRIHLKASKGGLRQMGSWDALRPKLFFAPRPVPSVLYLFRKYYGDNKAAFEGLKMAFFSYIPYKYKNNRKMQLVYGVLTITMLFPIVLFCFAKSWSKSSKMLKTKDELIEKFNFNDDLL